MSNEVIHWELGASDLHQERDFLAELFGWKITPAGPDYALVLGADPGIGGGLFQVSTGMRPYVAVYVRVDRIESTLSRAIALGATSVVGPTPLPGVGRFAMFEDPDGHLMGLLEEAAPASANG